MAMFGANRITDGLEDSIHIGDQFSVGSAARLPCFKLGIRFVDMVKRFLASRRIGFYLVVTREGEVDAADEIRMIARELETTQTSSQLRKSLDYISRRDMTMTSRLRCGVPCELQHAGEQEGVLPGAVAEDECLNAGRG